MREPDANICWGGGDLTGYKSGTCLGTGKSWSALGCLQLVEQAWSDGLDGHPFRILFQVSSG